MTKPANPSAPSVALRYAAARVAAVKTAGGFRKIVDEIEDQTGLEAKVEDYEDSIKIELYRGAKMVGYFRASTVNPDSYEWGNAPSECKEAWGQMGEPPVWVVRGAEWFDPDLRGKGFGKLLYRALFSYIASKKGVVGPDLCSGGNTLAIKHFSVQENNSCQNLSGGLSLSGVKRDWGVSTSRHGDLRLPTSYQEPGVPFYGTRR